MNLFWCFLKLSRIKLNLLFLSSSGCIIYIQPLFLNNFKLIQEVLQDSPESYVHILDETMKVHLWIFELRNSNFTYYFFLNIRFSSKFKLPPNFLSLKFFFHYFGEKLFRRKSIREKRNLI